MASNYGKNFMSFKRFMLRSEVLRLYRDIMRTVRRVANPNQRQELESWVRTDFKQNKHHTNQDVIKMMITRGRMSLKELEQTIPTNNSSDQQNQT